MISFQVLNPDEVEEDVKIPREIEIQQSLKTYEEAVELMIQNQHDEARDLFEGLLKKKLLKEKLNPISNVQDSPLHTLQFVVFRNYARLLESLGEEEATSYYLKAYEIDLSDIESLRSIVKLALRQKNVELAYKYMLEGFESTFHTVDRVYFGQMLAKFLFDLGIYPDAYRCCNIVLEMQPSQLCSRIKASILQEHLNGQSLTSMLYDLYDPQDLLQHLVKKNTKPLKREPMLNQDKKQCLFELEIPKTSTLSSFSLELVKAFSSVYELAMLNVDQTEEWSSGSKFVLKLVDPMDESMSEDTSKQLVASEISSESSAEKSGQLVEDPIGDQDLNASVQETDQLASVQETDQLQSMEDSIDLTQHTIGLLQDPIDLTQDDPMEVTQDLIDLTGDSPDGVQESLQTVNLVESQQEFMDVPDDPMDSQEERKGMNNQEEREDALEERDGMESQEERDDDDKQEDEEEKTLRKRQKSQKDARSTRARKEEAKPIVVPDLLEFSALLPDYLGFDLLDSQLGHGFRNLLSNRLNAASARKWKIKRTRKTNRVLTEDLWSTEENPFFTDNDKFHQLVQTLKTPMSICQLCSCFVLNQMHSEDPWTLKKQDIVFGMIQLLNQFGGFFEISSDFAVSDLMFLCELLIDRLPGSLIDPREENDQQDEEELLGSDNKNPLLRCTAKPMFDHYYCLLKRKLDDSDQNLLLRLEWLECKRLSVDGLDLIPQLKRTLEFVGDQKIVLHHCLNDHEISRQVLESKIALVESWNLITQVEELYAEQKLEEIEPRLRMILFSSQDSHLILLAKEMTPGKRLRLFQMLLECCKSAPDYLQVCLKTFRILLEMLPQMDDFDDCLETIHKILVELESRLDLKLFIHKPQLKPESEFGIPEQILWSISASIYCIWIVGSQLESMKKQLSKQAYTKRFKTFREIAALALALLFDIMHQYQSFVEFDPKIFISGHHLLGSFGFCAGADGIFLKRLLGSPKLKEHTFQCYKCLYGTTIKGQQSLEDHNHTGSIEFGKEPATQLYAIIYPQLLESLKTKTMDQHVKQALEMVSSCFKETSLEHPRIKSNYDVIQKYLNSDVYLKFGFGLALKDVHLEECLGTLYYMEAKVLFENEKSLSLLTQVAQKLLNHLYLRPYESDAWRMLAQCYHLCSNELLNANPTETAKDRKKISDLQKRAFHCFNAALKLLSYPGLIKWTNKQVSQIWFEFAQFSMSIYAQPLAGEALKTDMQSSGLLKLIQAHPKGVPPNTGPERMKQNMNKSIKELKLLIVQMLQHSLRLHQTWEAFYLLSWMYYKTDDPKSIDCFHIALKRMPEQETLSKAYKFFKVVTNLFMANKLTQTQVEQEIQFFMSKCPPLKQEYECFEPETVGLRKLGLVFLSLIHLDPEAHKPVFKYSWIMSQMLENHFAAKDMMAPLLQIGSVTRAFKSLQNNQDRPGGLFVSNLKYTKFLLDLAISTEDLALLALLCQRLSKTDEYIKKQLFSEAKTQLQKLIMKPAESLIPEFKTFYQKSPLFTTEFMNQTDAKIHAEPSVMHDMSHLIIAAEFKRSKFGDSVDVLLVRLYCKMFLQVCGEPEQGKYGTSGHDEQKLSAKLLTRALSLTKNMTVPVNYGM
ncbi:hypothetical protein EDD86DRAFT_274698, partial [Gorgonomyces haynaldii]